MLFSIVILAMSFAYRAFDGYFLKKDQVLADIRTEVSALNQNVLGKLREETWQGLSRDSDEIKRLNGFTVRICQSTNKIAELSSLQGLAAKCDALPPTP